VDELRQEQDNYKQAETLRKQVEVELREITVRLQDAEQLAQKEGKKMVVKLQARVSVLNCRILRSKVDGQ
jgi:transcription elongation GreA/GreB family factor